VTDVRLRELERRWKESGAPKDELAWLTERVRGGERLDWESYSRLAELDVQAAADYLRKRVDEGDLSQERLELAALCGHEVARVAGSTPIAPPEGVNARIKGLAQKYGREAVLRAVVAVGGVLEAELPEAAGGLARNATQRTIASLSGDSPLDALFADWQGAYGIDLICSGPATAADIAQLVTAYAKECGLNAKAISAVRRDLSAWALTGARAADNPESSA